MLLDDSLFLSSISLFFLFFLLNLIRDIFSLFIGIILSTNLLTELDIDRL